jgi:hypothetical protein
MFAAIMSSSGCRRGSVIGRARAESGDEAQPSDTRQVLARLPHVLFIESTLTAIRPLRLDDPATIKVAGRSLGAADVLGEN